jgi:TonB family protein
VRPELPVAPRPTAGEAGEQGVPLPGEEGRSDESAAGREGAKDERIASARLALAGPAPDRRPGGEGGARRAGRFDPRLLPVGEGFTGVGRGSPSADDLPGVPDGDATLVDTRAFRYAAFYRRVHEAIAREWDPNAVWDAHDPQDQVHGRAARRVLVELVLEDDGRLRNVRILRGSGLDFFDRECLRAVAAAAPFPNPPRGLVGPDGLVVLGDVGLLFEWGRDALLDRLLPGR